jgi:hypothetical protein
VSVFSVAAGLKSGQSDHRRNLILFHIWDELKNERRTSNIERPTSKNVFCQFKKRQCKLTPPKRLRSLVQIYSSKFCGSLIIKSIKRSVINIRPSMLDVRCSTFNLLTVPARQYFIRSFIQGFRTLRLAFLTPET